jgi:hypothetical protein
MMLRTQLARMAPLVVLLMPMTTLAQPAKAPDPIKPKELLLDPAAAPVPALKYWLLPSAADLNPGDAAPIYLRIRYQTTDAAWNAITDTHLKWRNLPLDQFPLAEARKFVDQFAKPLEQIAFGARRRTCDWNYTLPEQRLDQVNLNLADAQQMRLWFRVLDLKARVQIAEKNYDGALRTIETGMAFSRHIAEGTFLINGLIGLAGGHILLDRCEELIAQPGAPNLYWALTVLPRPLIDFRQEIENEQKLMENMVPELTEAGSGQTRTASEWASLLSRMHARIVNWLHNYEGEKTLTWIATSDLAQFKSGCLAPARAYLEAARRPGGPPLAEMSDDQIIVLYLVGRYREIWDDYFKASYLPLREAISQFDAAQKRLVAAKAGPTVFFVSMAPNLQGVLMSGLRTDRHVAALRVIEALRLYAAAHDGKLPESLNQITEVPVPEDPATGEPFIYRAADSVAIVHGIRVGMPGPQPSYRITIRH